MPKRDEQEDPDQSDRRHEGLQRFFEQGLAADRPDKKQQQPTDQAENNRVCQTTFKGTSLRAVRSSLSPVSLASGGFCGFLEVVRKIVGSAISP